MTWWIVGIVAFVAVDTAIAFLVVRALVSGNWGPIAAAPPGTPAEGAVHRGFQSFRLGLLNLGYSVHVSADDEHLHLEPARFLRWFGAEPASVPWSAVTILKRHRNGRWTKARIEPGTILDGPAWCLDLADPTPAD